MCMCNDQGACFKGLRLIDMTSADMAPDLHNGQIRPSHSEKET